jgi:hypothetical protein
MSDSMIPIFCADFRVKELSTADNVTLMGDVKGFFIHFVIHQDHQLSQYYLHRHEMAKVLLEAELTETLNKTLSCGLPVSVYSKLNEVALHFEGTELSFSLKKSPVGKQLVKDAALLTGILQESKKSDFKRKTILKFFGESDEELEELHSLWEWELVAFERHLLPTIKKKAPTTGIQDILDYKGSTIASTWEFMDKANWVITTDSCDCGSDGCFYSILNHTFLTHFSNKEQFLNGNQVDEEKLLKAFREYLANLTPNQEAALLFLDAEFQNTALLNMAMFNPDFDLSEYQRLLTYPYQPDSEDEAFVRTTSSLAWYYLSLDREHQ